MGLPLERRQHRREPARYAELLQARVSGGMHGRDEKQPAQRLRQGGRAAGVNNCHHWRLLRVTMCTIVDTQCD